MKFFNALGGTINDLVEGIGDSVTYGGDARQSNLETANTRNQIAAMEAQGRLLAKQSNQDLISTVAKVSLFMIAIVIMAYVVQMFKK